MLRTKLLQRVPYNTLKIFMSTTAENKELDKKFEHYKNLNELQNTGSKPPGWDQAKPFESMPGPKPLPIIGNMWRFAVPKVGDFYGKDFLAIHKYLHERYGDIVILKGFLEGSAVFVFDPKDIETLFRNEGLWPIRKTLPSLLAYRTSKKDDFPFGGLVISHGEEWFKFRSAVNPILMQPKNTVRYTDSMNLVAEELIDNIKYLSQKNQKGEMPSNFTDELYKWALESVALVTLDTRLGCLRRDLKPDAETHKIIESALAFFDLTFKLDLQFSMWRYWSTPDWKRFTSTLDYLITTNIKHVNRALDKLEKETVDSENETKSVLQQLLKIDRKVAFTMAIDMMLAGIDTTGRTLGACLYFLAKNTDKQKKLRDEAISLIETKDTPITKEILSKASYLKAVIKEVMRLSPIGVGNMRTTGKDLVLSGYQIPKGTDVFTSNLLLSRMDKHFPRGSEFLPERWLSSAPPDISHKNANPFIYMPFGFGPRTCVGKRLANLELEMATLKIIRNFEMEWPHDDMKFETTVLYGIADPLKIHMKELNS